MVTPACHGVDMPPAALSQIQRPSFIGKRYFSRARLNIPARMMTFDGTTNCTLIDLSRTGARIGVRECPRVGAMVVIEGLPTELFGTVRWAASGLFGFEFDAPLPLFRVIAMRYYADDENDRQKKAHLDYARTWAQGPARATLLGSPR